MLHSALGYVYLRRGRSAKSQEEFKIAISLTSSPDPIDYFRLGEAYSDQRKYDEAIEAFEKAAELSTSAIVDQLATEQVQKLKTVRDVMQAQESSRIPPAAIPFKKSKKFSKNPESVTMLSPIARQGRSRLRYGSHLKRSLMACQFRSLRPNSGKFKAVLRH